MSRPLPELLAEIDALKNEIDALHPLKPEQEQRIFQKFRLDWNYHSNAIEGNKLSAGETRVFLLEGLTAQGKPLKDHLDIRGHNEVIDYLVDFVRRKAELREVDIRGMHKILLVEPYQAEAVTPDGQKTKKWIKLGEYKTEPNQVTTSTGAIKSFSLPEETPAKMGILLGWYRSEILGEEHHPVVIAAILHYQFVAIHPFDDGNGRMARILMNLVLMQYGFPPVVIQTEERDKYFAALIKADAGEVDEFVTFIAEKLIASQQLYLRGARGESVEEADDIDKKVALFKQQLHHVPDPIRYSREIGNQFATGPIRIFAAMAVKKLVMFDDLFFGSVFQANSGYGWIPFEKTAAGLKELENAFLRQSMQFCRFQFTWAKFRKTPMNPFEVGATLNFHFQEFKYMVEGQIKPITRVYSEPMTEEDCKRIVQEMAENIFASIQQQSKKK